MNISKHHSLFSHQEISQICTPLFEHTRITHFTYSRLYDDGRVIVLVSDPTYHQHFWQQSYHTEFFQNYSQGVHYVEDLSHQAIRDAKDFGILHPMMKIYRRQDYYEGFGFGTSSAEIESINFYTQHIEIMNQFQLHFKNVAQPLIIEAQKHFLDSEIHLEKKEDSLSYRSDTMFDTPFFWLENQKKAIKISKQQHLCLKYLAHGFTSKGVAQKLNLSYRTIEKHLENIKQKLGLYDRNQLIDLYLDQLAPFNW